MDETRLNVRLDDQTAKDIKTLLWHGSTQDAIASHYKISQTTVSRIVRGKQWFKAPWPNGDIGAMPREKAIERKVSGLVNITPDRMVFEPKMHPPSRTDKSQAEFYKQAMPPITDDGPTSMKGVKIYADKGAARPTPEELEKEIELEKKKKELLAGDYQRLGEAAEQRAVDELESAVQTTGTAARGARKDIKDQTDLNIISWADIIKTAPKNKLVASGLVEESLRPAICQVFTALPKSEWGSAQARLLVQQTMQIMKEEKTNE